ncbi:hypothetical protein AMATHDRAFT_63471 [Amanita thiersii Skay4041]|uniref:DUF6533 domain-containing protein n=1 Tax=Amanita thiersii Skay4041 TaxID=703135 RepID=A0A2A9NNL6_9AGAR|nr:hypothetical protein AMATHDRAFT_63471 [Amanita thiersii Skay4041]
MGSLQLPVQSIDQIITAGWHLRVEDVRALFWSRYAQCSYYSKSMALVSLTILIYDHLLTFGDEVQYIWKRRVSPVTILYLINRYFAPCAFVICMVALFSANWTLETLVLTLTLEYSCRSFSKFEGVLTLVTVMCAEAILILRVYAVYSQKIVVLIPLVVVWVAQLGVMSYILSHSGPVIIPPSSISYGCILVADPEIGALAILFVVPAIVFDTIILVFLVFGLYRNVKAYPDVRMYQLLLQDGILYFLVVVMVNVAWTVTGLTLVTDMKNILSLITNILIGRLTLNIRMHGKFNGSTSTSSTEMRPLAHVKDFSAQKQSGLTISQNYLNA